MQISKNILVAPLNWGLGHATRCIPIIRAIISNGDNPIIASDGQALQLLEKEFPHLKTIGLPSYDIEYAGKGENLKLKLLKETPKIWNAIRAEHKALSHIIHEYEIDGVISDNRLGMYTNMIPCVIISHQLQVLSGNTTWLSTQLHLHYIKKFKECWIPDSDTRPNITGRLSHNDDDSITKRYLGTLSRFEYRGNCEVKYDVLALISGPEPQREIFEKQLLNQLKDYPGKVLFIAGKVEDVQTVHKKGNITYHNYLSSVGLQKAIERSRIVLCRSGYTSIMDLIKMRKKAFFIPTPGQFEQEYLASNLESQGIAPFANQEDFALQMLDKIGDYAGLGSLIDPGISLSNLLEETFSSVNENSEPIPSSLST
ncbi:glycosyltransferase family protein [Nonlabens ponticola]|uniref:Glycosyltransferase n=1 Tax=Nonlabens ponticola TaxID=2496866 RepID=A0A3S9MUM8_9FLAO|nr:glycosyltransferase family protein [Nonlabens ponticola]AZQ42886.1 glycosyltransferase [Nonlabens ponticola]